jgi:hypothetical protein
VVEAEPKLEAVAEEMDMNREPDGTTSFRQALDVMSEGVGGTDILDELQNNTAVVAFKGTGFVLSAGYLTWALRSGTLLASMVASLPAWQGFDPPPMLATKKKDKKGKKGEDDDGDDTSDADWQEARIQRVFSRMDSGESG